MQTNLNFALALMGVYNIRGIVFGRFRKNVASAINLVRFLIIFKIIVFVKYSL